MRKLGKKKLRGRWSAEVLSHFGATSLPGTGNGAVFRDSLSEAQTEEGVVLIVEITLLGGKLNIKHSNSRNYF